MGILEAMSYGIPCLITKGTSLTGVLEKYNAGYACETTADDIANAIEKAVLEKHILKEKSKNANILFSVCISKKKVYITKRYFVFMPDHSAIFLFFRQKQ